MAASSSESSSSSSSSRSSSRSSGSRRLDKKANKKRSHKGRHKDKDKHHHHHHHHKSSHHDSKEKEKKHHHHHHHHRKSNSSSSSSSSPKGKSDPSKKHKAKKEKEGKHGGDSKLGYQFGKYGIIQDTDLYVKREEFHAWLMDVKAINPESLSQSESKKHFSAFVEDYNLGILPGEKYYHLLQWEREQDYKKQKKEENDSGGGGGGGGDGVSPKKASGKTRVLLRGEIARMHDIAKEWAMASQEPDTFLQNDEELRRLEQKREVEERKRAEFQAQREITNLEHLARESEAMIKTLHQSKSK